MRNSNFNLFSKDGAMIIWIVTQISTKATHKALYFRIITFSENFAVFDKTLMNTMQLKTIYQKCILVFFRFSSEFCMKFIKKYFPTSQWFSRFLYFGILPDNRHKTSLTDNKKKMMKVFLWRPTWAHFHLELVWQFAIGDSSFVGHRIWVETLNYPGFKERWPWVHLPGRLVVSGPTLTHCPSQTPIIFKFHATLNGIWTSTLFLSEQVSKNFLPRFRSSFAEP